VIEFTLKCDQGHRFDSWFQSASAFDTLQAAGHVSCPTCGSTKVEKALMAPRVQASRAKADHPAPDAAPETTERAAPGPLSAPSSHAAKAMAELRRKIEENSDYVGLNFAREARDIHDGIAPDRPIYGEAKIDEAKKLIEDGVPVAPLPFIPGRKSN
jgi:hypothetical protein